MDAQDELLDLVNIHDKVIKTIWRSQTNQPNFGGYLRAAEAFIQNKSGLLWIPQRQLNKRIAPGRLDYSMGEHVMSSEGYLEACLGGFKEELNLNLTELDLEFVRKFSPSGKLTYFRSLYLYMSDNVPAYNPADFSEYEWLEPQKMIQRIKNGEPAKDSLLESLDYLINSRP